jgi:IS5 family transposase
MTLQEVYQIPIVAGVVEANLDPDHDLVRLGRKLDWLAIQDVAAPFFSKRGRSAKNSRLMVGALILKHRFNLSDDSVVAGLRENIYWRWFCGIYGQLGDRQYEKVLNASTLSRFRKRLGVKGIKLIESCIRRQIMDEGYISSKSQFVDTTAMEKNVAYPTDTNLLDRGRRRLVKAIKRLKALGLDVRARSFARRAKRFVLLANKLGKDRQERIEKSNNELMDCAAAVIGNAESAVRAPVPDRLSPKEKREVMRLKDGIERDTKLLRRVIEQTRQRHAGVHIKNKVLSLHEPQVVTIAKGKRGKPNEYGSKVRLSMDRNLFVVEHEAYANNVGDSTTLQESVDRWKQATGSPPKELATDRGFHTPDLPEGIKTIAIPPTGSQKHPQAKTATFRRLQRKRAAQEPVISHLKTDHRMDRSRYKGLAGDRINVSLAVIAWNTKRWLKLELQKTMKKRKAA